MILFLWILCGLISAGWMFKEELDTHGHISVGDLLIGLALLVLGPIFLGLYTIVSTIEWFQKNSKKIVFKKRKYDI